MIGGAQQAMNDLLRGFLNSGIEVTVVCPMLQNDDDGFLTDPNLEIIPIIPNVGRPLFPYERNEIMRLFASEAKRADVVWTLDASIPIDVPIPVVLTLDNFSYAEEMDSLWALNWDALIVPSKYLFKVVSTFVGPDHWEEPSPRIHLVPYGIDSLFFRPVNVENLAKRLSLSSDKRYLLFPHRPDPNKGFKTALDLTALLAKADSNFTLLIPVNETYEDDELFYTELKEYAKKLGITENVIFHPWIRSSDMAAYYSLGDWTLALGTFAEGFGLTPLQSISCNTPVISTRAGELRNHFPANMGVKYIDYGDVNAAESEILEGVSEDVIERGRQYVIDHFPISNTVNQHIECFERTKKNMSKFKPIVSKDRLKISPWCQIIGDKKIWNDYTMNVHYLDNTQWEVIELLLHGKHTIPFQKYEPRVKELLGEGILCFV